MDLRWDMISDMRRARFRGLAQGVAWSPNAEDQRTIIIIIIIIIITIIIMILTITIIMIIII